MLCCTQYISMCCSDSGKISGFFNKKYGRNDSYKHDYLLQPKEKNRFLLSKTNSAAFILRIYLLRT